jgi:peptide/nickel transport system permease protein
LLALITVSVALVINFALIHLAPGDPTKVLAGSGHPSPEMEAALTVKYGLDQPLYVQFFSYVKNLLQGDLGTSYVYNQPITKLIADRFGPSSLLALTSAILAAVLGTLLGLVTVSRRGSLLDRISNIISYFFYSMPSFWLGMMAILIFSTALKILPTSGMVSLRASYTGMAHVLDVMKHMVLPVGTLTLIQIPVYLRIFRTSVDQTMTEDFITTFRAVGMDEKKIFRRYVFKNSILPTITVFGINLAYTVMGSALIEVVFAWPGIGRMMLDAIGKRDYPLLMGIYLVLSISVALVTMVTDLVYAAVDPRIRYK